MERRLTYAECSHHFLRLFADLARNGLGNLPIFSGDLSVARRIRHRMVKEVIESHFLDLRRVYGTSIQVVRYKRCGGSRAMKGYLLPLQAAALVLLFFPEDCGAALLGMPEILYTSSPTTEAVDASSCTEQGRNVA